MISVSLLGIEVIDLQKRLHTKPLCLYLIQRALCDSLVNNEGVK